MCEFDKLSPDLKAERNKARREEDAQRHYQREMYALQVWFHDEMRMIYLGFLEEINQANLPKLVKTKWGVLFA